VKGRGANPFKAGLMEEVRKKEKREGKTVVTLIKPGEKS